MAEYDRQMLESVLEWWRDAGVDTLVEDVPRDWFAKPGSVVPSVIEPDTAGTMPETWEAFVVWRGGAGAPDANWAGSSVLASGPIDAAVMVLADAPDREDCAAGRLLTGEAGRLFDRMLEAISLTRDSVHLASICIKRPAGGRVSAADQARLSDVARHHLGLVTPKRLLVMGDAASRAVLGTEVLRARGRLHTLDHKRGQTRVVASFHPRLLLERPARKREAWADLQMLIRGLGE